MYNTKRTNKNDDPGALIKFGNSTSNKVCLSERSIQK